MRAARKKLLTRAAFGLAGAVVLFFGYRALRPLQGGPLAPATPDNPDLSWRETGTYPRGALVTWQGEFFTATTPSGPGNSVSPGGPQTTLFWRPGMVPIAWDARTRYAFGDEVEYQGERYQFVGRAPAAGIAPTPAGTDNPWSLMDNAGGGR